MMESELWSGNDSCGMAVMESELWSELWSGNDSCGMAVMESSCGPVWQ